MAKKSAGEAQLEKAELCLARGEPEDALGPAKEALKHFQQAKDEDKAREALGCACSALAASKDYAAALDMAKAELESTKQAGDKKGSGEMLIILSNLYLMMDQPKMATDAGTEAQEVFGALEDSKGEAKALRALLYSHLARGKKKMALRVAKQSLGLCQTSEDRVGEATSWNQLALAKMHNSKQDEVPQALNEAFAIYKEVEDKVGQASTLSSLAHLQLAKGNAEEALRLSEQARGLFQETGQLSSAAEAWDITVAAYMVIGKSETVLRKGKVELSSAKKIGDGQKIAAAEQRLIRANLSMGDEEGAMHTAKRACARMSESGDWKGQAAMLHLAAVLHLRVDRVELALRAAQEALSILRANKGEEAHTREQAALQSVIAEAHTKRGEDPPITASRASALGALEELGTALKERKVQAFEDALKKMQKSGAYTVQDTKAVIDPIVSKDESAAKFVTKHLPLSELREPAPKGFKMNVTCLRKFEAEPGGGVIEGMEWTQTMGKVVLSYVLQEETNEESISVKIAGFQVQVTIGGKKLTQMSGMLVGQIVVKRSWWKLESQAIKRRGRGVDAAARKQTLVISMPKVEHKAWQKLWYDSEIKHPAAKTRFAWTQAMFDETAQQSQETSVLVEMPPGKPPEALSAMPLENDPTLETGLFPQQSDSFMFSPDEVVVGVDAQQDLRTVTIRIIFDGEALRHVQEKIALEDILAADIWEDRFSIFLRGDDQNPILCGQFWSTCTPHLSTWKMTTDDSFRKRQANLSITVPVLKIIVRKSEDAQCRWNKIFMNCWQHRLMMTNSHKLEGMLAKLKEDEANGNLSYEERDDLYQRLSEWREERFVGLPEAQRLTRRGNDNLDSDFYVNLHTTVEEITKRTGTAGRARWSDELGRYSYVY